MMQYKVLYVENDPTNLENQINTLVSQGWHLESLNFTLNSVNYPAWTVLFVK